METQSAFMAAAAAAVLLVATLARRRDAAALSYAFLIVAFCGWSYGRGGRGPELPGAALVEAVSLVLIGPVALHLAARLVHRLDIWHRAAPALVLATAGLIAASLLRAQPTPPLARFEIVWAVVGVVAASWILWRDRPGNDGAGSPDAIRLGYVALAGVLVPIALVFDLAAWGLGAPRAATPLAGLLYLYSGYLHLARVRIVDLRHLTASAATQVLLAGALSSFFALLWLWVGGRLDLYLFDAFVVSLVVLSSIEPVRVRTQRAIERQIVARKLQLELTLESLVERLGQIQTLDQLLEGFLQTLERSDRVTASSVYLRDDPRVGFQQVASIGMSPRPRVNLIRDPVFVDALEAGEVLLEEDLDPEVAGSLHRPDRARILRDVMRGLDAQLVLPLHSHHRLVGFWTLRDASSEEGFSAAEIELLRDVAERTAASIENSKTFEQVRARDRFANLGEMAAGLAHEIRNPLAAIQGALAVLPTPPDAEARELHDVILEETRRLDRVVGTFLDYTQPTPRRARVDDPAAFLRDCVDAIARRSNRSDVTLESELEASLPALAVDPEPLETVLVNLLRNAYEALEGPGCIRVRAVGVPAPGELAEAVEVSIEDDGPGMDAATLDRALVPFFTTKDSGTGLGLPLCERLVRSQGGTLTLHSGLERGTCASLRLPVCQPDSEPEVLHEATPARGSDTDAEVA